MNFHELLSINFAPISLPGFSSGSQGITSEEAFLGLGPAARHLSEVWDLIWSDSSLIFRGLYNFCLMKISVWAVWTPRHCSRATGPWQWGYPAHSSGWMWSSRSNFGRGSNQQSGCLALQTHTQARSPGMSVTRIRLLSTLRKKLVENKIVEIGT